MSAFPTSVTPKEIVLISDQPVAVDIAESGKRQSRVIGGHLWRFEVLWPVMTRAQAAPLFAFVAALRGRLTSFTITLESHNTPQGVGTGTPLTNGTAVAGATSVVTDGWTAAQTGIMKAGDILKFSSHTKVYMVTADANSDVGGNATLTITPPLVSALGNNEAITVNDVPFTVALEDDPMEWKTNRPDHSEYSATLIEHI